MGVHGDDNVGPPLILRAKVALIGEAKVGKSAMCQVICGNQCPKSYNMTIGLEKTEVKSVPVQGQHAEVGWNSNCEVCPFCPARLFFGGGMTCGKNGFYVPLTDCPRATNLPRSP